MPPPTRLLTIALAALVLLAVACGPEVGPSVAPATPVPTEPPATPLNIDFAGGQLGFVALDQLGNKRDFPKVLDSSSPELELDRAVDFATEFLKDSRVQIGVDVLIDFCNEGNGIVQLFSGVRAFRQQSFSWIVEPNLDGEWNQPRVVIKFDDPELDIPGFHVELVVQPPFDGVMPSWFPSGAGNNTVVFDNPTCGE